MRLSWEERCRIWREEMGKRDIQDSLDRYDREKRRAYRFFKIRGFVNRVAPWICALLMIAVLLMGVHRAHAENLAVGDSIAVGTGQALHVLTVAKINAGSCTWILPNAPSGSFEHVVISAGINDPPGSCIEAIRAKYAGVKVVWILPAPISSARAHVAAVARANGDMTVSYRCRGRCTKTNFHPASYPSVAAAVQRAWGRQFGYYSPPIAPPASAPVVVLREREKPAAAPVPSVPKSAPRSFWTKIHDFLFPAKVSAIIDEESRKEGVPAELVKRVAFVESRGKCRIRARDGKSIGLMQVRPETARAMGVRGDQNDCRNSVIAGARYLKLALKRAHGDWALAASLYNHGLTAHVRHTRYSRAVLASRD